MDCVAFCMGPMLNITFENGQNVQFYELPCEESLPLQ